ncbi:MAG: hypothetical protein AB1791_17510 [Chloroflexota bacterium]
MPDTAIGMGAQDRAERDKFENEVRRIVAAANQKGVTLRLLGSLAFQFHCPQYGRLQALMGRAYTDIDLAGYGRQAKEARDVLLDLDYMEDREIFVVTEGQRAIFHHPHNQLHVDVFYNQLDFCHVIRWDGRLEVDSPTIPLAELLLEKMQIVQLNEKDVIDTIMLLLEHPLGDGDQETINLPRIANLCAADWGLWRTTTMNLDKVKQLAQGYSQLAADQKAHVTSQVDTTLARLAAEPKPLAWRLRHRLGDRLKWYKEVDEV